MIKNQISIDLGQIGHKSSRLEELFIDSHLVNLPVECDIQHEKKYVIFLDYTLGNSNRKGVKVLTNAFSNELDFFKVLNTKLINHYVEVN